MTIQIHGTVRRFPGNCGWYYVPVPRTHTASLPRKGASWGMVPVQAEIGTTKWKTSLLPVGDGSYFVAVKASVRKAESIVEGDEVSIHVVVI